MTEKKTFKITGPDDGQVLHDSDDSWYACCGHIFELSEWDMEVTFTKKPKQFRPGDKVNFTDSQADWYPFGLIVLAQHKDELVVVDPADEIGVHEAERFTLLD